MRRKRIMTRRVIKWIIISVVVLIICHGAVSFFFPWSPLNCRYEDVDIKTGRLRFTRYLLFCRISERVEDSRLSKMLPAEMVAATTPDWRHVCTFTPPGRHSPNHIFHRAVAQINTLASIWEMSETEFHGLHENIKQKTARHVLALWQYDSDVSLAGDYIDGLYDLMEDDKRQQILTALPTLQMPLVETNGNQRVRTVFFPNGQAMDRVHGYVAPSGDFIRHEVWEGWWSDGTRSVYGHFENDEHHGRRLEWDRNGKLIVIEAFNRGELSEYESDNLEQHPDYKVAQQLLARDGRKPPR